ncbi:MAG: transcriptional repressor [Flavobacteriales bacterium]|nr:transcriptional repressor [Flavobacteriales bacterium]
MGIVRRTKSLDLLMSQFADSHDAISAVALIESLKKDVNKTTVYRLLDRLEDDGVLHSFMSSDGIKWYAKCKGCSSSGHADVHPHFQCTDCGKVDCLDLEVTIPSIPGRKINSSQILIQGTCDNCLN